MKTKQHSPAAGFTLLESVVAFIILGLACGALMSLFGSAPLKISRAENKRLAVLTAQSALALIDNEVPLEPGVYKRQSTNEKTQWVLSIQPYETSSPLSEGTPQQITTAYIVTAQATAGMPSSTPATITTIRLKPGMLP